MEELKQLMTMDQIREMLKPAELSKQAKAKLLSMVIENEEQAEIVDKKITELMQREKMIVTVMAPAVEVAKQNLANWKSFQALFQAPISEALLHLKAIAKNYLTAKKRKAEEEAKKLLEKQQAKAVKAIAKGKDVEIPQEVKVEKVMSGTRQLIEYFTAEVVDFAKLPDEFKKVDQVKLNEYARKMKREFNIAGAELKVNEKMA